MINGRTSLYAVANGTMTGQRYIDEVQLPHVRLLRGAVFDKFVFMDDNATYHRTLTVQDCLDSEGIQRLVWPARSPDMNPIENMWDALGWNEKVSNHGSIPITIDCDVVAFIVFEEGFHQPIKRPKQSVFLDVTVFRHTLVD
ncbi:transposable element Tc1 transposase [Trichonephila clavipes]|nr:transposable element Tc1 transposase [Trichonephila clavipes]